MSFDYRGCFVLDQHPIDALRLEATLASFGLAFAGAFGSLEYNKGRIIEKPGGSRDFAAFVADGNSPAPSACGQLKAEEFGFDFGFVTLPGAPGGILPTGSVRAAWLEISDQKLYDMAFALEDQESNPVKMFAALHRALTARSMAFGMETSALQFLKFFSGQLSAAEVDKHISSAIAPPPESAAAMRQSRWPREIEVDGVQVLTRYLSGLDEYFPNGEAERHE
jgi:hypothetical protein